MIPEAYFLPLFADGSVDQEPEAKNEPQYHSSHIPLLNEKFDPEEGVYYIPKKENEVALNSFIRSTGRIHMFHMYQFTVSISHDVNPTPPVRSSRHSTSGISFLPFPRTSTFLNLHIQVLPNCKHSIYSHVK